jgi:hypothetical protein
MLKKSYPYIIGWRYNEEHFERPTYINIDIICDIEKTKEFYNSDLKWYYKKNPEDIKEDEEEWFNKEFARFYGLTKVKLGKRLAQVSKKVSINFENDPAIKFKNPINLSTDFAHSLPNSNLLDGENSYSATYETLIAEIDPTGLAFKTVVIDAHVLATSKNVDYVLVVSINDANDKNIFWQGKDIKNDAYGINTWYKETFSCIIKESAVLKPENKISVYLWNRAKNRIYVDDVSISFE